MKNNGVTSRIANNTNHDPEYRYFDGTNGDYYGIIRRAMKGGHTKDLGPDFRDGSGVSTVLIEHGYLSNSHDRQLMDSDSKLKALAKADADAIIEHYSLTKNADVDVSSYLFNSTYYSDMNSDLKQAFGNNEAALRNHYHTFGIKEGRVASPLFDPVYYLNQYSDLKNAFGKNYEAAYNHFVNFGAKEGRVASKYFDSGYYLNTYGDLKAAFHNNYTKAIAHFAAFGMKEGRNGSSAFSVKSYYNSCSTYEKNILGTNYIKYYAYARRS